MTTTDKEEVHSYGKEYDALFGPIRESATAILELGIDRGGSLLCWRDFFPNAMIYGVDTVDCRHMNGPRLITILADLTRHGPLVNAINAAGLTKASVDAIIDDGPHNLIQQFGCLYVLWPFLKPNGLYIVEDAIQMLEYVTGSVPGWEEPGDVLPAPRPYRIIDCRSVKNRDDDILIVFQK